MTGSVVPNRRRPNVNLAHSTHKVSVLSKEWFESSCIHICHYTGQWQKIWLSNGRTSHEVSELYQLCDYWDWLGGMTPFNDWYNCGRSQLVNFPINSPVCTQCQFELVQLSWCLWFSELLNRVWGLEGCPSKGQTMRTNRWVRFGSGGATLLLACVLVLKISTLIDCF